MKNLSAYGGIGKLDRVYHGCFHTEPGIRYDLAHGMGDDPYDGLDRFGRVRDLLWHNYNTSEDVVRIKHGYDRAGNRLYREDAVARANGLDMDEAYTYDGLYQLKTFVRGALNRANHLHIRRQGIAVRWGVRQRIYFFEPVRFQCVGNWLGRITAQRYAKLIQSNTRIRQKWHGPMLFCIIGGGVQTNHCSFRVRKQSPRSGREILQACADAEN